MQSVFLALPTHCGTMDTGASFAALGWASRERKVIPCTRGRSLLNSNCNGMLCDAINNRDEHGIRWFAMLHSDIEPEHWWLDSLIAEAERCGADMLAALVPIKDQRGITSTAIASDAFAEAGEAAYSLDACRQFGRITLAQAWFPGFPETFDIQELAEALERLPAPFGVSPVPRHALLLNTGCMVCRLDRPWFECDEGGTLPVYFSTIDGIQKAADGMRLFDISEDWLFSWRLSKCGGKCMATRKISAVHKGVGLFGNNRAWGSTYNDCDAKGAA